MEYQLSVNAPALLEESLTSPFAAQHPASTAGETPGHIAYQEHCQACHGENGQGNGSIPSLVNITSRLSPQAIRTTVQNGLGQMPAFGDLSVTEINEIISYLQNPSTGGGHGPAATSAPVQLGGDVVAWGGSPAGRAANPHTSSRSNPYGDLQGPPYPKGLPNAPENRYFTGWNVHFGLGGPPWNTLTAYNLNKGTLQWQVSVGSSPGVIHKQAGPIVTASGLVFLATTDGKVRAYDTNTGKLLWTGDLPAGAYGIPAMYEWDGREYLVVCATQPVEKSGELPRIQGMPRPAVGATAKVERAYVAFALPEAQGK
jgi:quinoprotein glucose dehydrogenase